VTVNTVVLVQSGFGLDGRSAAIALTANGIGSAAGALLVPALHRWIEVRRSMLLGALLGAGGLLAGALVHNYATLLVVWFAIGFGVACAATPAGALLRRSAAPQDRQALYVAQFALANASLLLAYPLAGWLGTISGAKTGFVVLGLLACLCAAIASLVWPALDPASDGAPLGPLVDEEFAWTERR
jgi:MFS family permease